MSYKILTPPLQDALLQSLQCGEKVLISGVIYTARDAAHQRMSETLLRGEEPPFPLAGQIIYYVGPSPAPPGRVIGSAGPTTSSRMDPYAPALLAKGLKGMLGKGRRSAEVREACAEHKAVYLAALGGAAALISQCIKKAEVVAYEELGAEAVRRLEVENLPAVVINDCRGNDLYEQALLKYGREAE
ncbi:MAG: Fe-S-containing hydro-lyase [Clostridiales bacterium]|nr:Fe-S-containing hydro-lyase [Clostridiales bacterium]